MCTAQDTVRVRCTAAVSCRVLCVCTGRCGESRWQKAVASLPQCRDPRSRTHHTVSRPPGALVQRRSRALWPYPPRIPWIATEVGCHSLLGRHPRALTLPPVVSRLVTRPRTGRSKAKFSPRALTLLPLSGEKLCRET